MCNDVLLKSFSGREYLVDFGAFPAHLNSKQKYNFFFRCKTEGIMVVGGINKSRRG